MSRFIPGMMDEDGGLLQSVTGSSVYSLLRLSLLPSSLPTPASTLPCPPRISNMDCPIPPSHPAAALTPL
jgi:hypothetical protein